MTNTKGKTMKAKTAHEVEEGTCILGRYNEGRSTITEPMIIVLTMYGKFASPITEGAAIAARKVEVLEEYYKGDFGAASIRREVISTAKIIDD